MEQGKFLPLLIICVQTAEGFIWNSNTTSNYVCVGDNIPLPWVYTLELGEILQLTSWTKSDGAGGSIFLADDLGGFTPATGYVGRLTSIGIAGIQISNATSSDTGTYTVIVALTSGTEHRMNATVHVHEIAKASCIPTCDKSLNCQIPQACPVQKYIDVVKYPNGFQCSLDNNNKPYSVCAEGDAVTLCYNGSSLCRNDTCIATTTETTSTTSASTTQNQTSSQKEESGKDNVQIIIISVSISGGIIVLGVAVIIIIICYRRQRRAVDEVVDAKDMNDRHGTRCEHMDGHEGNDFTESNLKKGNSSAQIHFSEHTSNHTSIPPQVGKAKPLAKKSKEAEHVTQEITNL